MKGSLDAVDFGIPESRLMGATGFMTPWWARSFKSQFIPVWRTTLLGHRCGLPGLARRTERNNPVCPSNR